HAEGHDTPARERGQEKPIVEDDHQNEEAQSYRAQQGNLHHMQAISRGTLGPRGVVRIEINPRGSWRRPGAVQEALEARHTQSLRENSPGARGGVAMGAGGPAKPPKTGRPRAARGPARAGGRPPSRGAHQGVSVDAL